MHGRHGVVTRWTGTLGAVAAAALVSGALLGCGGDGAGDGSGAPQQQEAAPQQAAGGTGQAGEAGGDAAPDAPEGMPEWMQVNDSEQTVSLEVVAARTSANSNWNFNGYANGEATVTVPEGYEITIEFSNEDPAVVHSLGVGEAMDRWPATFSDPEPVFEGAITSNPTSMSQATAPGSSETITFTAAEAGEYALICYIPGHATAGMWINFTVSADGSSGFSSSGA